MAKTSPQAASADRFDGITDNVAPTLPKAATLLFLGLVVWGLLFCGYYLFGGWTSSAEFEAKMKAAQPTSAPGGPR